MKRNNTDRRALITLILLLTQLVLASCSREKPEAQRAQVSEAFVTPTVAPAQGPSVAVSVPGDRSVSTEISYGFLDPSQFSEYWIDGTYRCGSDFPAGDYYIMSIHDADAIYDVENSPNDFSWSDHRVMRKVHAEEGQYVELFDAAVLIHAEEVNTNDWKRYGAFLVGTDLPAGDYKIVTITDRYQTADVDAYGVMGAYQICNNSPESTPEYCTPLFEKQDYISLKDGQYVVINNARMTLAGTESAEDDPTAVSNTAPTPAPTAAPTAAGTITGSGPGPDAIRNHATAYDTSGSGAETTTGQRNALRSAKSYLDAMAFSYSGLVEQLEYEGYTHDEAVYGVDNCGADWNEQAVKSARSYLDAMSFSRDGLIEQLEYEGFSHDQAVYGVEQNGY